MQKIEFLSLAENYDAFLCDLWGVIHDGEELYPGVLQALEALHGMGKKLVFLSNAPRLAETVLSKMDAMGVKREWYAGAMTSGEGAIQWLQSNDFTKKGGQQADPALSPRSGAPAERSRRDRGAIKYYYLGQKKDEPMLRGLPQQRVATLEEADFIFCGHFQKLQQAYEEVEPVVKQARELNLPLFCINPDVEVIKLDGTKILSAGTIAAEYEKLGGEVEYIGKPYPYVFEQGMQLLGNPPKEKVLMVGDNLMTDIKGGNAFGIDTAFVTQGILQNQKSGEQSAEDYCQAHGILPVYIIASL